MKWFKHYSQAGHSDSLAILEEKLGFEGIGRYWRFIEFLSNKFDGETHQFVIPNRVIRSLLRLRSRTNQRMIADCFRNVRGLTVLQTDTVWEIDAPILLELQGRDFKKARGERESSADKNKSKKKNKNNSKLMSKSEKAISDAPANLIKLIEFWNRHCGTLSKVRGPNSKRIREFKNRFKENSNLDDWTQAIVKLSQSDFCNARKGSSWKANFDFMLQAGKLDEILEGKYENATVADKYDGVFD